MSVSELADRVGLTVATTSLLAGELSRAGLVERSEDERDRRRTIVSLSEEIRKVAEPRIKEPCSPSDALWNASRRRREPTSWKACAC